MGINKEMFECLEEMFFEDMKKHPKKDAIPIDWLKMYEQIHGQETRLQEAIEAWRKGNEENIHA